MLLHAARSSTSTARQSTGAGGGLNFFTDDTPGLKLSPVRAMELATPYIKNSFIQHMIYALARRMLTSVCWVHCYRSQAILEAPESVCSAQIVVVFMSLGFIGFVTVLHIIGKVSFASLLRRCCNITAQ